MDAGVGIAIAIGFGCSLGFLEYMETVVPPEFCLEPGTENGEPLFVYENLAEREDEMGGNCLPVLARRTATR